MKARPGVQVSDRRFGSVGYTIIELIIALVLGVVILSAAVGFLITQLRTLEGSDLRENVARNGRYIGVSLRRDIQTAGVDITSTTNFGTVMAWPGEPNATTNAPNDTLILLHVPYQPDAAPPYDIDPNSADFTTLPAGEGTCGERCIDFINDTGDPLELAVGDLARLQVANTRRLILISDLQESDPEFQVTFTAADSILRQPAGIDGVKLDENATFVQKLQPIIYYVDSEERMIRSSVLNLDGSPDPTNATLAYGVEEFDVRLVFPDGAGGFIELEKADPTDSDNRNDYDDIVAVLSRVTVKAPRVDPRVNQGELLKRTYEWRISPRNLRYEKNRTTN